MLLKSVHSSLFLKIICSIIKKKNLDLKIIQQNKNKQTEVEKTKGRKSQRKSNRIYIDYIYTLCPPKLPNTEIPLKVKQRKNITNLQNTSKFFFKCPDKEPLK